MATNRGDLPALFYPADVAKALGMSEWWVKEQARRGRIPFTKPGRAYRFTAEQFAEIVRTYEARPTVGASVRPVPLADVAPKVPPRQQRPTQSAVRLRARPPRRVAAPSAA
ncbi:helix-turn-helix domain-containing protein [Kitasatospora purpeofusca]|uniref:helix-turn-helix domain-containing protein n=1 Tax=Kitasatospora purpeofusca TaxID=67352 RepID=UPI0033F0250C